MGGENGAGDRQVPVRRGDEGAETIDEALSLLFELCSALTYCHELWIVTERTKLRAQAPEMSFPCTVVGLSLRAPSRAAAPPRRVR